MKLGNILKTKGSAVYSTTPVATLKEVIGLLHQHKIGALMVCDEARHLVGIISERDVIRAIFGQPQGWEDILVKAVMTQNVVVGAPDDVIEQAMESMTARRIRHLPVLDGDALAGMLSIGDIIKAMLQQRGFENRVLKSYIRNWPEQD